MTKTNKAISVDSYIYDDFKRIVGDGNVSKRLEEFMSNFVNTDRQDIEGVNIKILNMEIKELQDKLSLLQSKLNMKIELKEKIEKEREEEEKRQLENEKKELELKTKCYQCERLMDEKDRNQFEVGYLCNFCVLNSSDSQRERWGKTIKR